MVDSNDVIVDCELNETDETAKECVKNTYQNPNYRNPSSQKTKTAAIKSRGNLLSRGEHSYVARRQQSRMAPENTYSYIFLIILSHYLKHQYRLFESILSMITPTPSVSRNSILSSQSAATTSGNTSCSSFNTRRATSSAVQLGSIRMLSLIHI